MAIVFNKADSSFKLKSPSILKKWIISCIQSEEKEAGRIAIILCSDDYLLKMNQDFLQHDYYTDIITFDYSEWPVVSGELYISSDRVEDNAHKNHVHPQNEMQRVIIHGVMHLCGYKDKKKSEQSEMRTKENFYLEKLSKLAL